MNYAKNLVKSPLKVKARRYQEWWRGIPHEQILTEVTAAAQRKGWGLNFIDAHLTAKDCESVTRFGLTIPNQPIAFVAVENYLDCEKPLTFWAGPEIGKVLIPMTFLQINRQHQRLSFRLADEIDERFDTIGREANGWGTKIKTLDKFNVNDEKCFDLLMKANSQGLIPWERVPRARKEYAASKEDSGWGLLKSFAKVAKLSPPMRQMSQVYEFGNMLIASDGVK